MSIAWGGGAGASPVPRAPPAALSGPPTTLRRGRTWALDKHKLVLIAPCTVPAEEGGCKQRQLLGRVVLHDYGSAKRARGARASSQQLYLAPQGAVSTQQACAGAASSEGSRSNLRCPRQAAAAAAAVPVQLLSLCLLPAAAALPVPRATSAPKPVRRCCLLHWSVRAPSRPARGPGRIGDRPPVAGTSMAISVRLLGCWGHKPGWHVGCDLRDLEPLRDEL